MLKSLIFVSSLFAAVSVGAAEPVVTNNEPVVSEESVSNDEPIFDIDLNAEDPCIDDKGRCGMPE